VTNEEGLQRSAYRSASNCDAVDILSCNL
jgi:hypothetical protein